jgi:hypothetical protein
MLHTVRVYVKRGLLSVKVLRFILKNGRGKKSREGLPSW